ncbi:hypothetical protein [Rhizobium leguminosarum]|uniref:hypothetical protein n=1 Tax=Rhizobium leguminosarum TaxID=384 RepID=UPI001C938042|nr:hypothetical protein [Rhizobium leguminosarum]MBY5416419.1 hypothetical protein [Rhizobium leguminosarum]
MRISLATVLLPVAVLGCSQQDHPAKSLVEQFGYVETVQGRELVEQAARKASSVLGSRKPLVLAGAWQDGAASAAANRITISLIAPEQVPKRLFVFVPSSGCACIFIQPQALTAWLDRYVTALPDQMLSIDYADALAFMLLHEVGHVEHGDAGLFEAVTVAPAHFDNSDETKKEEEADRFAVDAIVAAAEPTGKDVSGFLAATSIQMALSKLSWNLSAIRLLDNFGATELALPSVFGDLSYSHPNLELRILTVNYLLHANETSRQLLDQFLERRAKAREGDGVLFRRSP